MSKPPVLLAVCVSLLVASPAFTQTRAPHDPQPAASSSYPQKTQHIDIEDGSDVDGVRVNPNLELVDGRGRMRQSSLISIRTNFQAEILKSAESL
ncbi:MAG: hypothetical protein JNJ46_02885 [Myxococcales bacterium]|nr:hypothetical protein [Myxococcales bacterium]